MNEIKIFNNPEFGQIRTTTDEQGEPLFCLADVCGVLGLRVAAVAQRLKNDNLQNEKGVISNYPLETGGGTQMFLFVTESGLYDAIFDSRKPFARQFRKWVTAEVLPAIRKQGGYMTVKNGDTEKDILAKAYIIATGTIERLKERDALQTEELRRQAPKVEYYDNVLQSGQTYTTTQIAKEMGYTSAKAFNKVLNAHRIIYKQSDMWLLYSEYCGKDYTKTRTTTFIKGNGEVSSSMITVWTEKGRRWLHSLDLANYPTPKQRNNNEEFCDYDETGERNIY